MLWFGAFLSTIGTWMQKVTQSWLVLTITGTSSAFFLGLDSFLGELPILLFTVVGGVVADRRDRRQLLLLSQYVQMGAAFTLAALVYWDQVHIWHVLALSVVTGLAQAFGGPAYQSLLPSLVGKNDVPNAIAFNAIQFNLARVIGPLIAGAALAAFGMVACFGLNGLSFLAVIAALLSLHVKHIPPAATRRMRDEFQTGFAYVRSQPALLGLAVLGFAGTFLGNPVLTFLPLFAQDVLQGDVDAVHTSHVERRRRRRHRRADRRLARPLSAHGTGRPADSARLRGARRAVCQHALLLAERSTALWRGRVHGDGVRHAVIPGAAQRTQRDARASDEPLHGRVSWRYAARQPGRRLARNADERARRADAQRCAPQRGRSRVPYEGQEHTRPVSYLAAPNTNPTDRSMGLYDVPKSGDVMLF